MHYYRIRFLPFDRIFRSSFFVNPYSPACGHEKTRNRMLPVFSHAFRRFGFTIVRHEANPDNFCGTALHRLPTKNYSLRDI
jgi:hypothetical protein